MTYHADATAPDSQPGVTRALLIVCTPYSRAAIHPFDILISPICSIHTSPVSFVDAAPTAHTPPFPRWTTFFGSSTLR